jgi:hypothetical protein
MRAALITFVGNEWKCACCISGNLATIALLKLTLELIECHLNQAEHDISHVQDSHAVNKEVHVNKVGSRGEEQRGKRARNKEGEGQSRVRDRAT